MLCRSVLAIVLVVFLVVPASASEILADHYAAAAFEAIPDTLFDAARATLNIFYGHTSHGSQLVTGIGMLEDEDPDYACPPMSEYGDDLGLSGDLSWMPPTRTYLDAHPECNYVMWSWCGGCSSNTEEGIQAYLDGMGQLESEYPEVTFVYMTGHLDGTGADGNLYARNNQIRAWCAAHDKVLFDFADIESYDPDGVWYPDESDACAWCSTWCSVHTCPTCGSCAHSHCFNCYRKGKAFWWMMARSLGWTETVAVDESAPVSKPFALEANRPNPFNPSTEIQFRLAGDGPARLEIHGVSGRIIRTLVDEPLSSGEHRAVWDGTDDSGNAVPAGIYFCRLREGDRSETRKMILLK